MKKLILSALALGMVVLFSCNKKQIEVVKQETTTNETQEVLAKQTVEEPVFIVDKVKKMKYTDIENQNYESSHFLMGYEGENLAFTSDEAFLAWCDEDESRAEMAEKLRAGIAEREWAIEQGIVDDVEATERYVQEKNANTDRGMSLILYDYTNFSGSSAYAPPHAPTFFNFNNKAESMYMLPPGAVGALCSKTWYRGKKAWYFAFVAGSISNLWTIGMGNDAESNL